MPQFAHLDGTFVNAKITANNDGYDRNVVKLTVEPGEGEDGKLMRETDGTYKDMYYLQPDEYIQFGIMGYVTDDASAHKGAFTNDVIMEYVDFNGAGVEMVTKEEEPVIVSNKNGLMPNDGDRRIIDDEVVNSIGNYMPNYTGNHKKKPDDLWLSSSGDVVRGSVVPGINKTVSGDKTIYKATDSVDWKIQAINSGESWLSDYTISDTIEYPYTFNGKVCYSVFAPKPLREGEQSHRNRTWQPNEYIAACKASDSEYYLFDIRPSSEPNQFIILPANGSGLTQTITVNDKPKGLTIQAVQFGIDPLGADSSIFVSVTKEESTGSLTLNIRFGDKMWALLPGGGYGVLTVTTTNSINSLLTILDTNVKKTNFINSAIIYPSDEQNGLADYNRVTIGQKVAKSEDLYVGVQSNAAISAYESFPTTSVMEINETDKPENRGISTDLSGNTIFVDSTAKNVTYTMTVASYSGLVMEGLVVINSLPDNGDTLMFSGQARKSDFKISFLNDTAPEVYVNDAPYAGSYIIEYSDCTGKGDNNDNKFTAEYWQNAPNDTRWYSACKDTSRSVRVRFTGDLPENAEVKITYNAKIEADAGIENGKIAWNSFGYQYHPDISAMTGDDKPQQTDDRISAAPMVVGVSTPNELTLEKVIGNSVAFGNIDFNFFIYEGEAIDHQEFTEKAIGSALSGKNFTCATVTVQKEAKTGKTVLNEIGKNIFKYTYDPTTEKMVASTNPWTWVPGKKYTIVEIDPDGGADFEQFTNNGDNRRTYTFEYAPETEVTIIARNLYKTGELETYVSVKKVWDDDNNRDNIRPTSVTVKLLANGADTGKTAILNEANGWAHTFVDLPVRDNDLNVIKYKVEEETVLTGYEQSIVNDGNIWTITNKHTPEKTEVIAYKIWDDNNNQDNIRPASVKFNLYANDKYIRSQTLDESSNWEWIIKNLPKKENGVDIDYSITEDHVENYTASEPYYEMDGNVKKIYITNTHALERIEIEGAKTWNDNNNQDGKRPESIKINLYANGEYVDSRTVTEADDWKWTFDNLDKYANGIAVEYTITEEPVEGYTTEINGFNVTNTYTPEKTEVSGSKTWDDNNNQDGIRPTSITIHLFANGSEVDSRTVTEKQNWSWTFDELPKKEKGVDIVYTITEDTVEGYKAKVNGPDVTNTHKKSWNDNDNQDGIRPDYIDVQLLANGMAYGEPLRLSDECGWERTWENLPKLSGGTAIKYSVKELPEIEGYAKTSAITYKDDGKTINVTLTNTHNPEKTVVSGSKTWEDNNNQDGKRPESITINLLANGVKVDSKTVTAADNWSWTFDKLDKYSGGKLIVYTITEESVDGYTTIVNDFDVTNTHNLEKTVVSGSKTWEDNNNQDGKRPESITINLLANGVKVDSKTVTEADNWSWTFDELDVYANGNKITYTITEDEVADYASQVIGYNVTNTHTPEIITISGTKTWEDNNDQDGKRPTSITINLLADGTKKASKTITPNAEGKWEYTFENLPKNRNGKAIVYTIEEIKVEGYESKVDGYNVINTHIPETTELTVVKLWDDGNDFDSIRPSSITVRLLADGSEYGDKMVLNAHNNWTAKWENLPKYDNGTEIKYTVEEEPVLGYSASYSGIIGNTITITNTHAPQKYDNYISISGHKIWDDSNDILGIRPDSITVYLLADGVVRRTAMVTAANGWQWHFNDLDKYHNGVPVVYTVYEEPVEGYISRVDGYNIINYYIPEPLEPDIPVEAEQGSDSVDHSVSADSGVMAVAISVLLGTALAIGLAKILARKVNS